MFGIGGKPLQLPRSLSIGLTSKTAYATMKSGRVEQLKYNKNVFKWIKLRVLF